MRLDRANRSFLACMAIALLLVAAVLCGAVDDVAARLISTSSSMRAGSLLPAIAFLLAIALVLGSAAASSGGQLLDSRRLARRLRLSALAVPEDLSGAAARAGLSGRVVLIDAADPFSFVYGLLTPRVAVSRGLLSQASPSELQAVLEHERYHVRNLDPMKGAILRALSTALFFLPVLSSLRARYAVDRELAADRRAVLRCGRRPLAGALLKAVNGAERMETQVAAAHVTAHLMAGRVTAQLMQTQVTARLGGRELLDVRVAQLHSGAQPRPTAIGFARVAVSLLGVAVLLFAYLASVACVESPSTRVARAVELAGAAGRGGLSCGALFAAVGLAVYLFAALRARRPLASLDPNLSESAQVSASLGPLRGELRRNCEQGGLTS